MRRSRIALIFFGATALLALYPAIQGLLHAMSLEVLVMREDIGVVWLVALAIFYALLLAVPFVPGLELGIVIMVLFGPSGAVVAHIATVLGLLLSFVLGRHSINSQSASGVLRSCFGGRGLERPAFAELLSSLGFLAVIIERYKHLTVAILLNLPGNVLIGGGGGIAALSGASGQFRLPAFVLTCALATAPVPLLVVACGFDPVSFLADSR